MEYIIQASQLLLSLSLLIVLHELGHFIPAKLFKTKVEKFYLFFDYRFSLFKKKVGETVYGIGWIPLGGYVKIAGMIDESMDTDQMKEEPKPWEFRSKPAWQRLIIMVGGVTVNVILAVVIYIGVLMYYGEAYVPVESIKNGLAVSESGKVLGLESGDKVIAVDGKNITRFSEINAELLLSEDEIEIERDGQRISLPVNEEDKKIIIEREDRMVELRIPFVIGMVLDSSAAKEAGLQLEDSLVSLNGKSFQFHDQFFDQIPSYSGKSLTIGFYREGDYMETTAMVPESGKLGFAPGVKRSRSDWYEKAYEEYGLWEAIPAGWNKAVDQLNSYVRQLKLIFNPATGAYTKVGGVITIGSIFPKVWVWQAFWEITAFLSIMLAFLNILPIPALDGGHVVFVLIEMITGRKPSDKVMETAQMIGFFILLALIVLANGNDILGLFRD